MLLSVILLMLSVPGNANDVTRDFFGDIFRMRDCHNGSRCDNGGRRAALQVPGRPCYCQCAPSHLAYREDKQQCVKDIKECYMSVFYRPFTVEAIPLVYLPTSGQLVHPDAYLSLSMRRNFESGLAKCRVTVSQYLTREGWRTLTKMDGTGGSVFGLFTDANKTYLQFLGSSHDRKLLQQHMILVRLLCIIPQYPAFETCVAIRIGWVPGVENIGEIPAPSNKANMMVVGLSLGILALVYIFAVLVYLKIRRQMIAKQKSSSDQEAKLQTREDNSDKTSTLHRMEPSNRLELYHTASLGRLKPNKKGYRNGCDPWSQMSPLVETYNRTWTDRMGQHSSEFRAQDFKLQPEFFEPEFMASPPHEVLEYLERLQNSITFARHRMRSCYRYQPTLNGIPEDDYFYQELKEKKDCPSKDIRTTPDGGSASSEGSLQDPCEQSNDCERRELPKIPPRKPKRKTVKNRLECVPENTQSSDQEQNEIQKAMNTLNDTLDALEYDMYKQEILNQASDSETANLSCQNSTSIDFDDFETSSCSSMSAITVLGRDIVKRHSDISKCSQYVEKNQSEDFSTFSNSTFSLSDASHGLFHDGNKASGNKDPEKSNLSSRCPSQAGCQSPNENLVSEEEEQVIENTMHNKECDIPSAETNSNDICDPNKRPKSQMENLTNINERNMSSPSHQDIQKKRSGTPCLEYEHTNTLNTVTNETRKTEIVHTEQAYFRVPNLNSTQENVNALNSPKDGHERRRRVNEHKNASTSNKDSVRKKTDTPIRNQHAPTPSPRNLHSNLKTPDIKEDELRTNKLHDVRENENRNISISNSKEFKYRNSESPMPQNIDDRNVRTPNFEEIKNHRTKLTSSNGNVIIGMQNMGNGSREINSPDLDNANYFIDSLNKVKRNKINRSSHPENIRSNSETPNSENGSMRNRVPNKQHENTSPTNFQLLLAAKKNSRERDCQSSSDSEGPKRSNSTESLNTIATDMTTDSLDSRCTTPSHPSPTPSLMEMWINKLVSTSVPYSKTRRKSKKKLILPEEDVESWEHVCQKHKDPCPMHDINDSEPNLIDKLAHYSSKTMAGCDVAGYFHSLKQDVLKEHLKQWLTSNNQNKRNRNGISLELNSECSHTKPLVNGQEINLVDENGMHLSNSSSDTLNESRIERENVSITSDSLERNSVIDGNENGNIYFEGLNEATEKPIEA